jgi:AcrR family transcriptional regulator
MRIRRDPNQTRARLLDAALAALRSGGAAQLTLDHVAHQAGVSKGGLLHHFRSKEALVEAVLQRLFADFAGAVEAQLAHEPEAPGRVLRAYVRASLDPAHGVPLELAAPLMAALADQPALLTLIRADARHWQARLAADGLPPARAAVVRMAAESYWSDRLLGTAPEGAALDALRDELLALTVEGVTPTAGL